MTVNKHVAAILPKFGIRSLIADAGVLQHNANLGSIWIKIPALASVFRGNVKMAMFGTTVIASVWKERISDELINSLYN